jgi:hypothetical protein
MSVPPQQQAPAWGMFLFIVLKDLLIIILLQESQNHPIPHESGSFAVALGILFEVVLRQDSIVFMVCFPLKAPLTALIVYFRL